MRVVRRGKSLQLSVDNVTVEGRWPGPRVAHLFLVACAWFLTSSGWVVTPREVIIMGLDPRDHFNFLHAASLGKFIGLPLTPAAPPSVVGR